MLFGCCTTIENYALVAEAGFDTITLAAKDMAAMDRPTFANAKQTLAGGPLKALSLNAFCTADVRLNGPGYSAQSLEAYAAPLFARAAELGIGSVGVGSPASRNLPSGEGYATSMAQFEEGMATLCRLAKPYGIDVLLEAVCDVECNFITTTPQALAVVRRLALPNLHLVYDIYHAAMMEEPLSNIGEAAGEIRVVHIAQDVGRGQRHYLDRRHIDAYRPYLQQLREAGYQGEVCLEAFYGDPQTEFAQSLEILKSL